nr:uncharacterized protein LOC105845495 [Hydra vulgaris]
MDLVYGFQKRCEVRVNPKRQRVNDSNSLNPLDIDSRIYAKKGISEICTALKNYFLVNYKKINEIQPPLKALAFVDLIHNFVDLCIVDAANAQMDTQNIYERTIYYINIWINNLIWKNVELVFYFECRRLNQHQNVPNINELLNIFYYDIINGFNISDHTALFIIDGLDEFKYLNELINPSSTCNHPIVNALAEIQKYKHVIAGRVYAIDQYQSISAEHTDKSTIQVMGFNENGINNYVENNVKEEIKEVIKATLKESPIAKAMASVPFYLSSMCKIISDSKKVYTNSFLTMTDLYANIFLYFLQKHIIKSNKLIYEIMEDNFHKKYILDICKIAYELFVENKVVFSKEEIQNFISDFDQNDGNLFGFIEKIETNLGCHYQFAHLTIMEFCASLYAYNCLSRKEIMANEKLKNCLSMICGLTNKSQNSLLKFLVNLNSSRFRNRFFKRRVIGCSGNIWILDRLRKSHDDNLFIECFYESQSSFTNEIKSIVDKRDDKNNKFMFGKRKWWISINDVKTSYKTTCENYFINHYIKSERKLWRLEVDKNNLIDEEKKLLYQCSINVSDVYFHRPIKLEGCKPNNKIEWLTIWISRYLITKNDFEENFLPWINFCEGLRLHLHYDIDFIDDVYKWIRCSNIKKLLINYRGKYFHHLDELKNFITHKNV